MDVQREKGPSKKFAGYRAGLSLVLAWGCLLAPFSAAEEDEADDLGAILDEIEKEAGPAPPPEKAKEKPKAAEPAPSKKAAKKESGAKKARPTDPAPRRPTEPAPGRPSSGRAASDEDRFRELGLSREARQEEAKHLVRQAKELVDNGNLITAEGRLELARQLDPQNEEAGRLLSQVRLLLGDQRGVVEQIARDLADEQKVVREQAMTEIRRLINEGYRHEQSESYSKAVESYERAIEGIRHFPYDLNMESELRQTEARLERARELARKKEDAERVKTMRMLEENAERIRTTDLDYLENQIRELRRKAAAAESARDFERAIVMYDQILAINPRDERALAGKANAEAERHRYKMGELLDRSLDNFELAILGIEESSVTYQQIFRYPERREWLRISPKVVSLEEELRATETAAEKEIKRKLDLPQEIGFEEGVSFAEALRTLQAVSGINFVLNKEGLETAGEKEVKLERFPDLPLRNVLGLILQSAGEDFSYAIKEGAVVIGPKASLKDKLYLRFYEINDLIQTHPDFRSPPLALDELQGKQSTGAALDLGLGDDTEKPRLEADKILEIINKELGTAEGDATTGSVQILSGKLAARTTLENHLKLVELLKQFRKSTGAMVTVESRFLDIQDNFLEEIGVSWGSGNSTFLPNSIPNIDGAGTSVAPGWEYVNPDGDQNVRIADINRLSQSLGSKVNPFNLSSSGGLAYQYNFLKAERYQYEAILTAVAKEQEIRRLNSPRVTAFNGQIAHTLVVNQSAYIQDLEVNQTGVIPVINPVIDVLNSGSILEVRPTISHDRKYVVLEIQPTLAEQLDSEVAVLRLSGNFTEVPVELPVLAVTKIKTTVTVPDGGTVLVGGLKREISQKAQIGIPGLLDVPIVNLLWGRKGNAMMRSNLFVLINAKITIVHEEEARLFGT
jgi:Flp pilus assembly secretin CpaC